MAGSAIHGVSAEVLNAGHGCYEYENTSENKHRVGGMGSQFFLN